MMWRRGFRFCWILVIAGCGNSESHVETPMTDSPAADSQSRVFAESYILRAIDEFDDASKARLMEACPGSPYQNTDEALDDFEASESITEAQVEWMQQTWQSRKAADAAANARRFAAEVAPEVFTDLDI